jgi:hypothetical protein
MPKHEANDNVQQNYEISFQIHLRTGYEASMVHNQWLEAIMGNVLAWNKAPVGLRSERDVQFLKYCILECPILGS